MNRLEDIRRHVDMARAHCDEGGQFTNSNVDEILTLFEEALSVMLPEQEHALDGVALRMAMRPDDRFSRKAVTKASRLLVHAAGGRIEVPFHLADIVDEIELDQTDEPHRSRVVYTTHHRGGAAGTVIDGTAVAPPMRRLPGLSSTDPETAKRNVGHENGGY